MVCKFLNTKKLICTHKNNKRDNKPATCIYSNPDKCPILKYNKLIDE
jgi:hypothetical protein